MLQLKWQEGRQPRRLLCFSAAFFLMAVTVTLLFVRVESRTQLLLLTACVGCLYAAAAVAILREQWNVFASLFLGLLVGWLWCCGSLFLVWDPAQKWDDAVGTVRLELDSYAEGKVRYGIAYGTVTHLDGEPCGQKVKVYLRDGSPEYQPGDVLLFEGSLHGVERKLEWNLLQQGVFLTVSQEGPLQVAAEKRMTLPRRAAVVSHDLAQRVLELIPGDEGALLAALLSGSREHFSDAFDRALTTSGTRHITAVSGLHVMTLAGILLWVFGKRLGLLVAVPVSVGYAAITGFSPSVVRVVILLVFWAASFWLKREKDLLTALAAALLVLVAWNPFSCVSAGLLLSFSATLGLILLSAPLYEVLGKPLKHIKKPWLKKILHYLAATTTASFAATMFTMPLNLLFFETVPLLGILSNLLILWALSGILVIGISVLSVSCVWMPVGQFLADWVLYWPLTWVVRVIRTVGSWRFAATDSANLFLAIACVVVLLTILLWRGKLFSGRKMLVTCTVILCIVAAFTAAERMRFGLVEVHNCGNQPVFALRGEGVSLINTGAKPDGIADAVQTAMDRWNAVALETVVCTTGDYRTQSGLSAVAECTAIGRVLMPSADGTVRALDGSVAPRVFADSGTVTVSGMTAQLLRGGEDTYGIRLLKGNFSLLSLCGVKTNDALRLTETYPCEAGILVVDDYLANDWQVLYDLCQRIQPEQILVITGGYSEHGDRFAGIPLTLVDDNVQQFRFVR
ncbi:MAG: ComEC/Rec2 family competence protein [Clostridia bacterium]|nr:ComEC/Rec2 family competence protein [Clostridia bacterium]